VKIIKLEQGTPAWHAWRNEGLGSSDVSAIAAHANLVEYKPWMKPVSRVYEEKKGLRPKESFDSWLMRRGHAGEGFVRAAIAEQMGMVFVPLCIQSDDQPLLRASLDGIDFSHTNTLEIKNPNDTVHSLAAAGVIVDYYLVQMLHQQIVLAGHPETWLDAAMQGRTMTFASGRPEDRSVHRVTSRLVDHVAMAVSLYDAMIDFIDALANDRPPMGEDFMAKASRYTAIQREIDFLQNIQDSIKGELSDALDAKGRVRGSGGGLTLSWQEPKMVVSSVKDLIDGLGLTEEQVKPYKKERSGFWRASVSASRKKES
jgi:putative phage-type endonuclease